MVSNRKYHIQDLLHYCHGNHSTKTNKHSQKVFGTEFKRAWHNNTLNWTCGLYGLLLRMCDEKIAFLKVISFIFHEKIHGLQHKKISIVTKLATQEFQKSVLFTQIRSMWKEQNISHTTVSLVRLVLFFFL